MHQSSTERLVALGVESFLCQIQSRLGFCPGQLLEAQGSNGILGSLAPSCQVKMNFALLVFRVIVHFSRFILWHIQSTVRTQLEGVQGLPWRPKGFSFSECTQEWHLHHEGTLQKGLEATILVCGILQNRETGRELRWVSAEGLDLTRAIAASQSLREWQPLLWKDCLAVQRSINPALERKLATLMTTDGKCGKTWKSLA